MDGCILHLGFSPEEPLLTWRNVKLKAHVPMWSQRAFQYNATSCSTYWMVGLSLPMGFRARMGCANGRCLDVPCCSVEHPITNVDQALFGSLLTLYCSWFSYVFGPFSSLPPPAPSLLSRAIKMDPFISSPATILPAPLIIWLTHLWTSSKLSVYSGFLVSSTKSSLPGVADD